MFKFQETQYNASKSKFSLYELTEINFPANLKKMSQNDQDKTETKA